MENKQEEVVNSTDNIINPSMGYNDLSYIVSVKKQGDGWLLNGSSSVPNIDDNSDCIRIKKWLEIEGNVAEDEFTSEQLELTRIGNIKNRAGQIISERYPTYKQQNVALGLESKEYGDAMKKFIKDIKAQSTKLEKDVTKTSDDFIVGE